MNGVIRAALYARVSSQKQADDKTIALEAAYAPSRTKPSNYPEPFFSRMGKRVKRPLGDLFGLGNFGVNLTTLEPGAMSALRHWHKHEDEFVFVIDGEVTLITDAGEEVLGPGMAATFPAGEPNGHHLVNRSSAPATFLEVGTRSPVAGIRKL